MPKKGYTYILTNKNHTVLYTVVTSNLLQRMQQHKTGKYKTAFSHRYNVTLLVYYEVYDSIVAAIAREKQIKAGSRQKKLDLINSLNPEWKDLSEELPGYKGPS
jgi:putative endonuclease